ncbi:Uncharacterized protein APZ42_008382, partial [Daphnia magna]
LFLSEFAEVFQNSRSLMDKMNSSDVVEPLPSLSPFTVSSTSLSS